MLLRLLPLLLLPNYVECLKCYVCGEGNTEEFGECRTQFQFDCSHYASRFPPDEKVFCRTMRKRELNDTFTVTKECITDEDHFRIFPDKGYPLNEECDVIDVDGQEIAYCLCKEKDLCNRLPIAEQFMTFEQENPELFGDDESDTKEESAVPSGPAPLAFAPQNSDGHVAFGAPALTPPAIVPINDPRFTSPIESEIRRQQLPSRTPDTNKEASGTGVFTLPKMGVSESGFVGSGVLPSKEHIPQESLPARETAIQPSQNKEAAEPLFCMQCGERELSTGQDCAQSSKVACVEADSLCFTRRIKVSLDENAIEKMCVSTAAVSAMFGEDMAAGGCGVASQGNEEFCTCTENECNKPNIDLQQASWGQPAPPVEAPAPPPFVHVSPQGPFPHLAAPELPISRPDQKRPVVHTTEDSAHEIEEQDEEQEEVEEVDRPRPIVPENSQSEWPQLPLEGSVLHCAQCLERDVVDPVADCVRTTTEECSGKSLCITKQTQMTSGFFTMEKKCTNMTELARTLPHTKIDNGCATADNGMINYCICSGSMCNTPSLLQQATRNGVRESFEAGVSNTDEGSISHPIDSPTMNVEATEDFDGLNTNRVQDFGMSDADRELLMRQRVWAEADLKKVSPRIFLTTVILFCIVTIILPI